MTGAKPLADQTVIIQKGRIANIASSNAVAIPRGAQILDARGKFLIPGLVDMHIHITAAGEPDGSRKFIIPLLLANGITSVRDMGGYLESLNPLRKEIAEGKSGRDRRTVAEAIAAGSIEASYHKRSG